MKISILTPDMSSNCFGRAYIIAKLLESRFDVEIVGPLFGENVWMPMEETSGIVLKYVRITNRWTALLRVLRLPALASGDILYASKPLVTSFGIGLLSKLLYGRRLVLDVDDWEAGFHKEYLASCTLMQRLKYYVHSLIFFCEMGSIINGWCCERLIRFADDVTVSSVFLRNRYGGIIIPHARDTVTFRPDVYDKRALRSAYGISTDSKVVMFLGSPRPYKGIDTLIRAVNQMTLPGKLLLVIGINDDDYSKSIVATGNALLGECVRWMGPQPFSDVPRLLSLADVMVIPQQESRETVGQLPAKLFDAMSMSKPIVATRVSDIASILDGCGWIVEPGSADELAKVLKYVLTHPDEAEEAGRKARTKCQREFDVMAVADTLVAVFLNLVGAEGA